MTDDELNDAREDQEVAAGALELYAAANAAGVFDVMVGVAGENIITVHMPRLLAEVERLRAALREIADSHVHQWDAVDPQEVWACEVCHADSQDYATDVQETARKALGE